MKVLLRTCPQAQLEHAKSRRQFAHVFHEPNQICVAPEFYDLPDTYKAGILLHELGHLAHGDKPHSESDAHLVGSVISGVKIHRRTLGRMKKLETVRREDLEKAMRFLKEHITA